MPWYSYGVIPNDAKNLIFDTGTSMAAPAVSGMAALLRQALASIGVATPSSVLLKAIIINSADNLGLPRSEQGYGRVNTESAVQTVRDNLFAFRNHRAPGGWSHIPFPVFSVPPGPNRNIKGTLVHLDLPGTMTQEKLFIHLWRKGPGLAAEIILPGQDSSDKQTNPWINTNNVQQMFV
jgi:hypothetical protein